MFVLLLNSTTQIRPIDISFSDLLIKASGYPIPNAIISAYLLQKAFKLFGFPVFLILSVSDEGYSRNDVVCTKSDIAG
jgi:hypothetical protein